MNCADARERASAWLDRELTAAEAAVVQEHLAGCSDCAREFELLRRTAALVTGLPRRRAPVGLAPAVSAALAG
ncbi:MAG: zf-HC2 domain-containing protein, partial [Planctomycetes bacterium]|nr:zf-HC2 domain-containing protein [Planctomycetota bacterium]